jgi:hypothetical protein
MAALTYTSTFDTGTTGLMGVDILQGERPLFFYGERYLGALEAYIAALIFKIFGASELTLSLSPILFSIAWLFVTYLLFSEIAGRTAGIAAAFVIAIPGWHILWYNIAAYGCYPGFMFFGTLGLWLSLRISSGELSSGLEWIYILLFGFIAGVAMWTSYQAASYLVTGGILLAIFTIRRRFNWRLLGKFVLAGALFVVGFLPVLVSLSEFENTPLASWELRWDYVKHTANIMSDKCIPELIFWPLETPHAVKTVIVAILIAALVLYICRVILSPGRYNRLRMLIPVLFAAVFLLIYLPHTMASLKAARYVIPVWSITLCALFATPLTIRKRWMRVSAIVLLSLWTAYNIVGAVLIVPGEARDKRARIEIRQHVVKTAERAGAKTVEMVGGRIFGFRGQTLSFYAGGKIRFVSVYDERHQPSAQLAETALPVVLACDKNNLGKVRASLEELGIHYVVEDSEKICLFHNLRVRHTERRSIPSSEISVTVQGEADGSPGDLIDRTVETSVEGAYSDGGGITVDIGREVGLDSIWLTARDLYRQAIPRGYSISVSTDGENFTTVSDISRRISVSYRAGTHVYFLGYFGLMETVFDGIPARYVRFRFNVGPRGSETWNINEIFLFERTGENVPDPVEDARMIADTVKERGIDFTVCDRWLSAKLIELLPPGDRPPAYPRFNPKYQSTLLHRRIVPRKGLAIAPATGVADECVQLLTEAYGESAVGERIDFSGYSLLLLGDLGERGRIDLKLVWNGHTVLKTSDPEEGWYNDPAKLY